jgi:hypothetical protein
MSPRDRALWLRFQRRAATVEPDVARELFRAWEVIRESLTDAELTRLIASGQLDKIIDDALLDRAFGGLRVRLVQAIERGFRATLNDLPKAGKVEGTLAVQFNTLNPRVIDAARKLDSRVINTLKEDVRDVVRAHVENGLRDGRAPASVARELRAVIGLAPNQEEAVRNFRRALEGEPKAGDPLSRVLRDRRFDRTLERGAPLSEAQIETMTAAYRRKMLAFNAQTNAHTATLDSYKLGQKLSWDEARAKGVIPDGYELVKTWVQIDRPTKRESHIPMHGETVPFDSRYSNGDEIPGESEFNCACISRVSMRKVA